MPATLVAEWARQDVNNTTFLHNAPLPRFTPLPSPSSSDTKRYEALVIGAGPSGLMLTTLLTRYGLPSTSLLCIDSRPHQTLVGNADGINARTLEILGQLGLESRIRRDGTRFAESTVWTREESNPEVLVKKMTLPFDMAPARYEQLITLHQGHIESIFREDLKRYDGRDVQYGSKLVDMRIDEDGDKEFPVLATIERDGVREEMRTKYLVGADGAKSAVRGSMGVELEGDMTDELWGVIDLVVDSDFPDVRRQSSINTLPGKGGEIWVTGGVKGGFIVPRERLSNGDFLTRLYLDMTVKNEQENGVATARLAEHQRQTTKERRNQITEALILDRAAKLFRPFRFEVKKGTQVHWWAAFRISQSLTKSFTLKDSTSHPRVFIVGDACHSHSPRQGQGMNVSMQDSFNLAWKLAYSIFGIDASDGGSKLLDSYEEERLPNARNLIAFDKRMNQEGLAMKEKWAEMKQFVVSCGVEYGEGLCVSRAKFKKEQTWTKEDYLNGVILPGRRLLNCRVKRFADGNMRDIHDELGSEGRFSIMMLASYDFGVKDGRSTIIADDICSKVIKKFSPGLIQPIIVQPHLHPEFQWTDLPSSIRQEAEMSLHNASADTYKVYGVEHSGSHAGALIVVRPDGIVGMMAELEDTQQVVTFLKRMVRTVE
ncbi:related to phenol monooxygenase [Phialocephala subalpina]|uniref:Related to phenol monooxygenase n=1 Tax=Phialocephala subalpina TaxID=576137 RepID=A0A1L7XCG5_9HELO|nr:related to phenol monooxygenase [Phialocephala subalpina]